MIHYSCDRCKRMIDPQEDLRYVVKLEAYPAMELPEVDEVEDDRDHLSELQEILEHTEDFDMQSINSQLYQKNRFDLCSECYKEFIKNPIGREPAVQFGFSQN